jgi:hypothetical protein
VRLVSVYLAFPPGTAATAAAAVRIPNSAAIDAIPLDPAMEDAIDEQQARVKQVLRETRFGVLGSRASGSGFRV